MLLKIQQTHTNCVISIESINEIQRMDETLHIKISREDKLKLLQEAEALRLPLSSYCRMKLRRESNTYD